jgi:hypothetical protein
MGLRWAHLAVKEWQFGKSLGKHPNVVDYDDVMLHNDDDSSFKTLLEKGYEDGKLKSRKKRTLFPDRYICLTQELMNRGTVQDWMDTDCLLPGGMLSTMQSVASALAFLHKNGVTHNDIKPENVMLHQEDAENERSTVIVKLGDLGCCTKSTDTTADYWQYGMTVFCMATGEKFGTRKYREERVAEFCAEAEATLSSGQATGKLGTSLAKVPDMMRGVFPQELSFADLRDDPALQDWEFFDGEAAEEEVRPDHRRSMRPHSIKITMEKMHEATSRHACQRIDE